MSFLVVIRMTPLAALLPYNAAEAAPVSTEIFSTSSGLSMAIPESSSAAIVKPEACGAAKERLGIGIPSTTYKALLFCVMEVVPRRTTLDSAPTPDAEDLISTPAILPERLLRMFPCPPLTISAPLTFCTL